MADERSITQRLFEALVERGLLTAEQLNHAQEIHAQTRQPLGEVLVARGLITPTDVRQVLEDDLGVPHLDLASYAPEPAALRLVPADVARGQRILPLFEIEGMLTVAVANPLDVFAFDVLSGQLAYELEPVLSDPSDISEAIEANYGAAEAAEAAETPAAAGPDAAGPATAEGAAEVAAATPTPTTAVAKETLTGAAQAATVTSARQGGIDLDVLAVADPTATVMLVTDILEAALDAGASHVHVDPGPEEFEVAFRVGADKRKIAGTAIGFESALLRSVRSMAHIGEAPGAPAAGRMKLYLRDKETVVGVSMLPTVLGERLVMSLPGELSGPARLDETGMAAEDRAALDGALARGRGLLVVSGPIRSGRSTTYDLVLGGQVALDRTVLSIEDRVDRELPGAWQVDLTPVSGLSASSALSAGLRQDADVIGVDEVRRADEAHLLLESASSGRLALATTIGSDACDTVGRWVATGVEPESLAHDLSVVMSQRIVSRNCPHCREPYVSELAKDLEVTGQVAAFKGTGCGKCDQTGVSGGVGVYEVLVVDDALRHAIALGKPATELRQVVARAGARTLLENGYLQVAAGELTLEELNRAVPFARV